MAAKNQSTAVKNNVKKAAKAPKRKRSLAHVRRSTKTALSKQGAAVAKRKRTGASTPKTCRAL